MNALLAPALLALVPLQSAATLLRDAPEGWRFERLDFPLSFAPEIELEGFEELSFAPGMFEPADASYFSYALAIRVEGEVDMGEDFLRGFLAAYYRGLCRAVGEGRGLDLDLARIATTVERTQEGFVASVDMFDPFVTGEPLTLRIELDVHPGARSTELLGLASPAAPDDAIWDELAGFRERWRAERPAALFLNHLYVVPDQATFDALATSDVLHSIFPVQEQRETVRADMTYRGIYFYGQNTYFEFLPPGAEGAAFPRGSSGVAFGFERKGATERFAKRLDDAGIETFAGPITRELAGEQVPWFDILGVQQAHEGSRLNLFTLEYDPRFLESWHPDESRPGGDIARSAVLGRYATSLGQAGVRAQALFQDVTLVRLALDERERARLFDVCRAGGYVVEDTGAGWSCTGPGVTLAVEASDTPGGVTGFDLTLRHPIQRAPTDLGSARLAFEGNIASFTFPR